MNHKNHQTTRELYYSSPNRGAEKKINLSTTVIVAAICLAVGVLCGFKLDHMPILSNDGLVADIDFNKDLNEVYHALASNYHQEIDRTKIIEEAKRGLVAGVGDPYSYYMSPEEYAEFNDSLNGNVGAGIGVEMGVRDGYVKVLRTTPDNPAREAGILSGDIIYKVNGEDILGKAADEVANLVRGEAGSEVTITVLRDQDEKEFTLKRETINDESVYVDYRDDDQTAILTITRFDNETGTLAERFAKEIKEKGVKKLILDLRNNGGGYVNAAVDVASLWLDGKLVTRAESKEHSVNNEEFNAYVGKSILKDMQTVVLINGSTASAAEILAGALRDYDLATLVGEDSYGKGSMQSLVDLDDGGVLRVTIANWYLPNGDNINDGGIKPDEFVERTYEQINKEIDPQLEKALAL